VHLEPFIHEVAPRVASHDSQGSQVRTTNLARRGRNVLRAAVLGGLMSALSAPTWAADIDTAVAAERKANAEAVQSQKRINKIDDETDRMAIEYRSVLDQVQSLRVYNAQLDKLIAAQNAELDSLDDQIGSVTEIGREVTPLMLRMVDTLGQFVEADVPMLLDERRQRVADLRDLLDRADVADSEKYRRIMEAYQIENEYGRTIEVYQDEISIDGQERTFEFLRVGRVALVYQTLDGAEVGAWDPEQGDWVALPDSYRDSIRKGIRIARKQLAPDMVRLPVPAPEETSR
jgi:hypothetical protein